QVGASSKNLATILAKLAKASKGSAALLNDDQAQKGILNSVKNVGSSTQQLVQLSKDLQVRTRKTDRGVGEGERERERESERERERERERDLRVLSTCQVLLRS